MKLLETKLLKGEHAMGDGSRILEQIGSDCFVAYSHSGWIIGYYTVATEAAEAALQQWTESGRFYSRPPKTWKHGIEKLQAFIQPAARSEVKE